MYSFNFIFFEFFEKIRYESFENFEAFRVTKSILCHQPHYNFLQLVICQPGKLVLDKQKRKREKEEGKSRRGSTFIESFTFLITPPFDILFSIVIFNNNNN